MLSAAQCIVWCCTKVGGQLSVVYKGWGAVVCGAVLDQLEADDGTEV
jgi:hypothetical protein